MPSTDAVPSPGGREPPEVVVLGGRGHLGSRIAATLTAAGVHCSIAGRTGPLTVDLRDPRTLDALPRRALVINATDTFTTPPDGLYEHALHHGLLVLETAADVTAYERLRARRRQLASHAATEVSGAVVAGAGVFPGLSNLLGAHAVRHTPNTRMLVVVAEWSLLSGAGGGTVETMVRALREPVRRISRGEEERSRPIGERLQIERPGKNRDAYEIPLPEPLMLHDSTRVPTTRFFAATHPGLPRWVMGCLSTVTARRVARGPSASFLPRVAFRGLRSLVLRRRTTPVALRVGAGPTRDSLRWYSLEFADAFATAGAAAAAAARLLRRRAFEADTSGIHNLDELLELGDVLELLGVPIPEPQRLP
ncbi:MAG: hypothetical protein H6836_05550 [Planctomycetes bacterium]|nr:hypothetical protein [Planctomycetota bacterium]MCB9889022.1 hypothetical protein [Planctomycetota bacterium]